MEPEKLPEDVVQIIFDRIDSVPHLEALILIQENAPRGLTGAEISARVYVTGSAADKILLDLQRQGFVAPLAGGGAYALNPEPGNTAIVARLAAAYRQNVYRIASLIHLRASRSVREFAKAFDIKGKD